MSVIRARKPFDPYTLCRVPTPPIRGSANGLHTSAATSGAQIVSESTSATSSVDARFHPRRSASRLPGTSVVITVTGYRLATSRQVASDTSITRITSRTRLANHDSIAAAKTTGSSWYTGTTTLIGSRKRSRTGR